MRALCCTRDIEREKASIRLPKCIEDRATWWDVVV